MGKTTLASTLTGVVILSAEHGLLSLADYNIPVIEIKSVTHLTDAYNWLSSSDEASGFESVCIDSVSDVSEVLLAGYKKKVKDPRQAYGMMNDEIADMIRKFRALQKHVYFIAKLRRLVDEGTGKVDFVPSLPGVSLMQNLPYFFDLVCAMRFGKNDAGKKIRYLQTEGDLQWIAKDRSGRLDKKEGPDLGAIISKMKGE